MEGGQECQICLNEYSRRRRAKRLACRHTCCSACLRRMVTVAHGEAKGDQRGAGALTHGLGHVENAPHAVHIIHRQSESTEEANGNGGEQENRWHNEMTRRRSGSESSAQRTDGPPVGNRSAEVVAVDSVGTAQTTDVTRPDVQTSIGDDQTITDQGVTDVNGTDLTADRTGERPRRPPGNQTTRLVIVCPWCRGVTVLSDGPTADRLPDDEDIMGAVPMTSSLPAHALAPEFTTVFMRVLPITSSSLSVGSASDGGDQVSNSGTIIAGFNQLPPGLLTRDAAVGTMHFHRGRVLDGGSVEPGRAVPFLPGGYRHSTMWRASRDGRWTERGMEVQREEGLNEGTDEETKSRKIWRTSMCAVITLGLGVFMLVYIVLHSVTCSPKPFTMISCR